MVFILIITFTACTKHNTSDQTATETEAPAEWQNEYITCRECGAEFDAPAVAFEGKIAIISNPYDSNGYDATYAYAQIVVGKYGEDKVIHVPWPANFSVNQVEMNRLVTNLGADPEIKAIIVNQAVHGTSTAFEQLMKTREDLLVIFISPIVNIVPPYNLYSAYPIPYVNIPPQENPAYKMQIADIILDIDELGLGPAMVRQAQKLGAKTFVHYSWLSYDRPYTLLFDRRELIRKTCAELGMEFVDIAVPDHLYGFSATSDDIQQFISEVVSNMVAAYGQDTAFFVTDRGVQIQLAEAVIEAGAIYPQPYYPNPKNAFLPVSKIDYVENTNTIEWKALGKKDELAKLSAWPVDDSFIFTNAAVEYAVKWINNEVPQKGADVEVLRQLMEDYAGVEVYLTPCTEKNHSQYLYGEPQSGETYNNAFLMRMDYVTLDQIEIETIALAESQSVSITCPECGAVFDASASAGETPQPPLEDRIAIISNPVGGGEEEYRSARMVVEKYGEDKVVHKIWPSLYSTEEEEIIQIVDKLGEDPTIKAIIANCAISGTAAAFKRLREIREDIFIIFIMPQDNPADIVHIADIVLDIDEFGMGPAMVRQARELGAKTFVHYSNSFDMSIPWYSAKRDLIKATCAELGMEFVDATIADPANHVSYEDAQQLIFEDVPKMVARYSKDTAFYATSCGLQPPLIRAVIGTGAIYPQQCCTFYGPNFGFSKALYLYNEWDEKPSLEIMISLIRAALAEKDALRRLSAWPELSSNLFTAASAEYAFKWISGEVQKKGVDNEVLKQLMENYAGVEVYLTPFINDGTYPFYRYTPTGETYNNYLRMRMEYITF